MRKRFRRTACAVQLVLLCFIAYWLAPSIAVDGMFTSDYYSALIFIFAGMLSIMQKFWNPYSCHPIIYTAPLWANGADTFYHPKEGKVKLDLYQWIHLHPDRREVLLFWYCRKIFEHDVLDAKDGKTNPWVVSCKDVLHKRAEDVPPSQQLNGMSFKVSRCTTIRAGTHGCLIGPGQGGMSKYNVMWFDRKDDSLQALPDWFPRKGDGEDSKEQRDVVRADPDTNGSAELFNIDGASGKRKMHVVDPGNWDKYKDACSRNSDLLEVINGHRRLQPDEVLKLKQRTLNLRRWVNGTSKRKELDLDELFIGWPAECDPDFLFECGIEWIAARRVLGLPNVLEMPGQSKGPEARSSRTSLRQSKPKPDWN